MGNMKFFWLFGFEWWGGLRPAEMTTAKGVTYVPLFWGLWVKRLTKRAADVKPRRAVKAKSRKASRG
jgi:hypothetical protein